METLIPSPAACEVRSVIKFLNAQKIAPIEIHRQLCQVYGLNIMSKQLVLRWCRQFSEGRQSAYDEERSGRLSLINVDLVRQRVMENRRFTIMELSSQFPQISRSLLHEIVTKHLLFKNMKTSVTRWFHSQVAEFYHTVIQKLIPRFDKCLNSGGDYVEK
ncbi:uncharacterized protein TNCV_1333271 [Trichonephila clavipes]|nr:uncharacterized protein TNCV_1333271 [Trichonephila clavipes]